MRGLRFMRAMVAVPARPINGPDALRTTNYKSMTIGAIDRRARYPRIAIGYVSA